ncbi:hypothetical protein KY285_024582 [Solanum tuberosum]|nr:hypothetical protein KY285_024582 [Solanum tuberosum]
MNPESVLSGTMPTPLSSFKWGMDRLNIPLGSLVLTLLCGIHSRSVDFGLAPGYVSFGPFARPPPVEAS